jgi:ADP-ribose pyrophosphatase YjhB (NUDIX family)
VWRPASSGRIVQRLIHAGARFTRPLTMGVRAVILDRDDRLFLVRHSYVPGWHLPGGAVEPGETAVEALRRETLEECNIALEGEPVLHGLFFNRTASKRDHVVVYIVRDFRQVGSRAPDWEILEARFFALPELPEGTTRATRARLREIHDGGPPSHDW